MAQETELGGYAIADKIAVGGMAEVYRALAAAGTQRNAEHVGWRDRGVVAPGYLADLNVIALGEMTLAPPAIVQDLPAGGTRLLQKANGYRWTVKSGQVTFENGEWTGLTPGGLLRGERDL